ncbi:MAG: hypothetical protein FWF59_11520 [Turicibacter sp.]|nr:hypothetical protein [Turicibacter sp.]
MPAAATFKISIRSDYSDVYDFLKSQDNASLYLCRLVRKDMERLEDNLNLTAMKEELQAIRSLIQGIQRPTAVSVPQIITPVEKKIPDDELDGLLNF